MIHDLLKQLGFGDKEVSVYLTVLQQGKVTANNVAKLTKINRTTVYSVAKELLEKGVISEDLGSSTSFLVAKPPQDLMQLVIKQEKETREKKQIIDKAILELQSINSQAKYSIPKIVFISDDKFENYLYTQTPIWDKSIMANDGIWWGFQDASFVKHYENWIDWYWEKGGNPAMNLQIISNESAELLKKKKYTRRSIKQWTGSKDFTATTWVMGDYVAMLITNQRPHYLVEIHDTVLAHNMRELFKGIWTQIDS
jgi:sugar-specific transcriptional regulator TrmB